MVSDNMNIDELHVDTHQVRVEQSWSSTFKVLLDKLNAAARSRLHISRENMNQ